HGRHPSCGSPRREVRRQYLELGMVATGAIDHLLDLLGAGAAAGARLASAADLFHRRRSLDDRRVDLAIGDPLADADDHFYRSLASAAGLQLARLRLARGSPASAASTRSLISLKLNSTFNF